MLKSSAGIFKPVTGNPTILKHLNSVSVQLGLPALWSYHTSLDNYFFRADDTISNTKEKRTHLAAYIENELNVGIHKFQKFGYKFYEISSKDNEKLLERINKLEAASTEETKTPAP